MDKIFKKLKPISRTHSKVNVLGYVMDFRKFWKRVFRLEKWFLRKRQNQVLGIKNSKFGFKIRSKK
jgi:hypothetical protein